VSLDQWSVGGSRIAAVEFVIRVSVEPHGCGASGGHGREDPENGRPGDRVSAMDQEHGGQGKRQGKNGVAEFNQPPVDPDMLKYRHRAPIRR